METEQDSLLEASEASWISISDLFLLTTLLLLAMLGHSRQVAATQRVEIEHGIIRIQSSQDTIQKLQREIAQQDEEIGGLKKQVARLELELMSERELKSELSMKLAAAEIKIKELTEELAEARKSNLQLALQVSQLLKQVANLRSLNEKQVEQIAGLMQDLTDLTAQNDARGMRIQELEEQLGKVNAKPEGQGEGSIRQELVGLRGKFQRVAFLVDRSGSMKDKWPSTHAIVRNWLTHLDVQECILIVFGDQALTFRSPSEETSVISLKVMASDKESGKKSVAAKRQELLDWLQAIPPDGLTNTLAAFQEALKPEHGKIDTVLLFTDGLPTSRSVGDGRVFDVDMSKAILKLCKDRDKQAKTNNKDEADAFVVNTIGLGNFYADPRMASFLIDIVNATGGSFLARQ